MTRKLPKKPQGLILASLADAASLYCAFVLLALVFLISLRETTDPDDPNKDRDKYEVVRGNGILDKPCDEIYVVQEGETLHTISDKCGDPFIVEGNPHIHDPDDVFPGIVIKITHSPPTRN